MTSKLAQALKLKDIKLENYPLNNGSIPEGELLEIPCILYYEDLTNFHDELKNYNKVWSEAPQEYNRSQANRKGYHYQSEWLFQATQFHLFFKELWVYTKDEADEKQINECCKIIRWNHVKTTRDWRILYTCETVIGYGKSENFKQLQKDRETDRCLCIVPDVFLSCDRFMAIVGAEASNERYSAEDKAMILSEDSYKLSSDILKNSLLTGMTHVDNFLNEKLYQFNVNQIRHDDDRWFKPFPDAGSVKFNVSGVNHYSTCRCHGCIMTDTFSHHSVRRFLHNVTGGIVHGKENGLCFYFKADCFIEKCPTRYLVLYFLRGIPKLEVNGNLITIEPNSLWIFDTKILDVKMTVAETVRGAYYFIKEPLDGNIIPNYVTRNYQNIVDKYPEVKGNIIEGGTSEREKEEKNGRGLYDKTYKFLEKKFDNLSEGPSEINQHLHHIYRLATECRTAIDISRDPFIDKTVYAILKGMADGLPGEKIIYVDFSILLDGSDEHRILKELNEISSGLGIKLIISSKSYTKLPPADLVFINDWHVYGQVWRQLTHFENFAMKYIVLHNTSVDALYGESVRCSKNTLEESRETGIPESEIRCGILPAINNFLAWSNYFELHYTTKINHGLHTLKRHPEIKKKVLVLIIADDKYQVYLELQKVWRKYMQLNNQVECYFLKNNPSMIGNIEVQDDTIFFKEPETFYPGILVKTVRSIKFFENRLRNFEFIIRTNLSSFYRWPQLIKYLDRLPKCDIYSGIIEKKGVNFASGAGIIFSVDQALELANDKKLEARYGEDFDDVVIGYHFNEKNMRITECIRKDFLNPEDYEQTKDTISEFDFHFRIRHRTGDPNIRLVHDISTMKKLLKRFYGMDNL